MARATIVLLLANCGFAQDANSNQKNAAQNPSAQAMPTIKPAAELDKLVKQMAGRWHAEITVEPNGFMPSGTARGNAMFQAGPGGLSLLENFHSRDGALGNFAGHGVTWWSQQDSAFRGIWCDNMAPSGCETSGTGKWQGSDLVFTGNTDEGGQKMSIKQIYTDITADAFTYRMEVASGKGAMKPFLIIKYTRAQPRPEDADAMGGREQPRQPNQ